MSKKKECIKGEFREMYNPHRQDCRRAPRFKLKCGVEEREVCNGMAYYDTDECWEKCYKCKDFVDNVKKDFENNMGVIKRMYKMEYIEARDYFKEKIGEHRSVLAHLLAIQAIELQIPKQVKIKKGETADLYICPNCSEGILPSFIMKNRCYECGQLLDIETKHTK